MSNFATLKAAIQAAVYTNATNDITGAALQQVLLDIVDTVGAGYTFMGVATPGTSPGTPDTNVFYIGGEGTYTNFGSSYTVALGQLGIFIYNGSWTRSRIDVEPLANEVNISKVYPTGGTGGGNTYSLQNAVAAVSSGLQSEGVIVSFIADGSDAGLTSGKVYSFQFTGGTWESRNFRNINAEPAKYDGLIETQINFGDYTSVQATVGTDLLWGTTASTSTGYFITAEPLQRYKVKAIEATYAVVCILTTNAYNNGDPISFADEYSYLYVEGGKEVYFTAPANAAYFYVGRTKGGTNIQPAEFSKLMAEDELLALSSCGDNLLDYDNDVIGTSDASYVTIAKTGTSGYLITRVASTTGYAYIELPELEAGKYLLSLDYISTCPYQVLLRGSSTVNGSDFNGLFIPADGSGHKAAVVDWTPNTKYMRIASSAMTTDANTITLSNVKLRRIYDVSEMDTIKANADTAISLAGKLAYKETRLKQVAYVGMTGSFVQGGRNVSVYMEAGDSYTFTPVIAMNYAFTDESTAPTGSSEWTAIAANAAFTYTAAESGYFHLYFLDTTAATGTLSTGDIIINDALHIQQFTGAVASQGYGRRGWIIGVKVAADTDYFISSGSSGATYGAFFATAMPALGDTVELLSGSFTTPSAGYMCFNGYIKTAVSGDWTVMNAYEINEDVNLNTIYDGIDITVLPPEYNVIKYTGAPIVTKRKAGWSCVFSSDAVAIGTSANYGRYSMAVSKGEGTFVLYDLVNLAKIYTYTTTPLDDGTIYHANCATFSDVFYNNTDIFPLLYVSVRVGADPTNHPDQGSVNVYRIITVLDGNNDIQSFTATKIQTIWLPAATDDNGLGTPNVVYDSVQGRLWAITRNNIQNGSYYHVGRLVELSLPASLSSEESVTVLQNWLLDVDVTNMQGGVVIGDLLMYGRGYAGVGYIEIVCVNLQTHQVANVVDLYSQGFTAEPEGALYYDGDFWIQDANGYLYRFVF